ncbi:MAG: S41 family peptidase, partial [Calditrichota bacterium]
WITLGKLTSGQYLVVVHTFKESQGENIDIRMISARKATSQEIRQYEKEKNSTIHVKALTREERSEKLYQRYPDFPKTRDNLWNFEILNDQVAKLTVNSFGLFGWKRMTLDYKAFLANAFNQLKQKNIPNLIIDVRKNNGGNDEMKDELFSYLTPNIRHDFKREGRTRYVNFPESVKPYIKTWEENPWYFKLNPENSTPINGYYIFKNNFTAQPPKNDMPIYQGDVYLLSSAANTSLAFYVVNQFKQQNIGTIIGQETGGNLNDINGGTILFLTLPNSQIEIDVPIMGGFSLAAQPNSGVKPDIETTHTFEDIISDKDVELETALRIIKTQ